MSLERAENWERQAAERLALLEGDGPVDAGLDDLADLSPEAREAVAEAIEGLQLLRGRSGEAGGWRSNPPVPPDFQIQRFRIERELGRGGFGVVFRAFDLLLHRTVAVKVPRPEALASEDLRRRFLREARLAARLDHPNIVAVYEAGEEGGVAYIASAFCAGPDLAQLLERRAREIAPRDAARLVRDVADGVGYAHARGVLHRDVKPSNILLVGAGDGPDAPGGAAGETESRASDVDLGALQPKLADFGLARALDAAEGAATAGTLGTPMYMSPELVNGGPVDERSDVYSVGVVLYELLAGEPPFRGTREAVYSQILLETPRSPRRLQPGVPRDLETICLKCLEKRPRDRYPSAAALRADLDAFLELRPISARPSGPVRRLAQWGRRKPAVAALCAALALVGLTGAGGVVWQWRRAEANLEASLRQQRIAEHRFVQIQQLLDDYFGAYDEMEMDVALAQLRERLNGPIESFYERLFREPEGEPEVDLATARARSLYLRLLTHEHKTPTAEAAFVEAQRAWDMLTAIRPEDPEIHASYAALLYGWANQLARWDRHAEALAVLDEIDARWPPNMAPTPFPTYRRTRRDCQSLRCASLIELGRGEEARPLVRRIASELDGALGGAASETQWRARVRFELAIARAYRNRFQDRRAHAHFETALRLIDKAASAGRGGSWLEADRADALWGLGVVHVRRSENSSAVDRLEESNRLYESLESQSPALRLALRRKRLEAVGLLSHALEKLGDDSGVRRLARKWDDVLEKWSKEAADNPDELALLAAGHARLASSLDYLSNPEDARKHNLLALDLIESIRLARPLTAYEQQVAVQAAFWYGRLELESESLESARAYLTRSVSEAEGLASRRPESADARLWVARGHFWLARIAKRTKRDPDARRHYGEAARAYTEVMRFRPQDPTLLADLAECREHLDEDSDSLTQR